jgi:hypothetical protein
MEVGAFANGDWHSGRVHNAALSWQQAAGLTAALAVLAAVLSRQLIARLAPLAPFAREATLISGLYTVWQLAGELSVLDSSGAYARGAWIERTERAWHLPAEVDLQRAYIDSAWVIHASNIYYATMHFGMLFVFLIWLFVRHRDRYPKVRRVLALTTLACLLIQLLPVAPPRLLPQYGYLDTAARMGESVYSLGFGADALSAMPSVHVAWAVLIAWAVYRIGSGAGRWLGVVHAVLTMFVIVVTANHFWADGIVAVGVLIACALLEDAGAKLVERVREPAATHEPLAEVGASS